MGDADNSIWKLPPEYRNHIWTYDFIKRRTSDRKKSIFFKEHCRVPAEVAYETRRAKHAKLLDPITIEMTPGMLAQLAEVMASNDQNLWMALGEVT